MKCHIFAMSTDNKLDRSRQPVQLYSVKVYVESILPFVSLLSLVLVAFGFTLCSLAHSSGQTIPDFPVVSSMDILQDGLEK